ncbi:hypothetical protein WJX74_008123 [Apatococcus lobatus]|uniref:Uncharacterized protein n=1 Tax=Apatococcus lobatus TaxID=904363 RepID=A0AAW1QHZ6_9CHLO
MTVEEASLRPVSKRPKTTHERLEVPTRNPLEDRLRIISQPTASTDSCQQSKRPDFQPTPDSELLARLKGFLPRMAVAHQQLGAQIDQQGVGPFSIEHEDSDSDSQAGPRIELDLTCGLVDLQDEAAVSAAEHAAAFQGHAAAHVSGSTYASESSADDAASPPSSNSSDTQARGVLASTA